MWAQLGFSVLQVCLSCLLGWRELGKQGCFLGQLVLPLLGHRSGSSVINLREKVLLRALNDQITTRRAAVPEVIQSLSDKYPPMAVEGAGEHQPVLGLCEILRRQILLVPGRQHAGHLGKDWGGRRLSGSFLEKERWRKRVHMEKVELIILLVYGTLSITGLSKAPLLLSLFCVTLISHSHCCPLHRKTTLMDL